MAAILKIKCLILFGSETGTAEDIACKLYKSLDKHMDVKICAMDDCEIYSILSEEIVIFICSTYGI